MINNANMIFKRAMQILTLKRHRHWLFPLLVVALLSTIQLQSVFAQGNPGLSSFQGLSNANTGLELPNREQGGINVNQKIRPVIHYPSLKLDKTDVETQEKAPPKAKEPDVYYGKFYRGAPHDNNKKHTPTNKTYTEFEQLIESSTGRFLPTYGKDLFTNSHNKFSEIDQVNVPSDFIVGPGDELHIRAWGSIDIDYKSIVDRSGTINIPKVGDISLNGLRYSELEQHITKSIQKSFHNFELSVSLGKLRSVRIYVTGFAKTPGSYAVNSLSSLVNAVFISGGPNSAGDLRNIQLKRNGKVINTLDMYEFLLDGEKENDVRLQPGDVIHIPPLYGQVAIFGSVNNAAIFHLKQGESIGDLLKHAGGLSTTASKHKIKLERITKNEKRTILDVEYNDESINGPLNNGDLVIVSPISPKFKDSITLKGHVAQPLRYKWESNMRISDLIPSSEALISPSYWMEYNRDDQVVNLLDKPKNTLKAPTLPQINWEYAVIERIEHQDISAQIIPFNLNLAINHKDPLHNKYLRPGDTVTIYSLNDFRTPIDKKRKYVTIEGEVTNAGIYPVNPGDTIVDILKRAGGVTDNAYLFATSLQREETKKQQQKKIKEAIDRLESNYQRYLIDRSRNTITNDQTQTILPEAYAIGGLIEKLRSAKSNGRIILDLDSKVKYIHQLPKLRLENNDAIYIPPVPQTIEVVGAVYRQGSFIYDASKSIAHYKSKAGLIDTADAKNIYLVRPDGSFTRAKNNLKLLPGDTVVVPEKVDRQRMTSKLKDWTQILYQFGLGAAGLAILDTI